MKFDGILFRMRVNGTRENCYRLLDTIRTYTGYISEPQIVAETGTSDDYLVEIRGEVNKSDKGWHHLEYLIYAPEHERSLEALSGALNLAIEVFGSYGGEDVFEYYYYKDGMPIDIRNFPVDIEFEEEFDDYGIDEEDRQKYEPYAFGFTLKNEYIPDACWDYTDSGDDLQMECDFKLGKEAFPDIEPLYYSFPESDDDW